MTEPSAKKRFSPFKYFREVKAELKKVVWPTPKQLFKNTVIVLVSIAIVGAFIALLDYGFDSALQYIFNR